MPQLAPPFDPIRFEQLRAASALTLGHSLTYFESTGSTNDELMRAARAEAPAGTVFLADYQSHGRGRHGNHWSSPVAAENLLFSLLLRPGWTPEQANGFTLVVGLAVRDAVQPLLRSPVKVKWTNDVYVERRKLAGILVESQCASGRLSAIVVGIGLNVLMQTLPPELAQLATSLSLLGASSLDREALLVAVLEQLERRTREFDRVGLAGMLEELRSHDAICGERVRVLGREGIARGISDDGALLLEERPGEPPEALVNGLVELLGPSH